MERADKGGWRMRKNGDWMKAAPLVLYVECSTSLIF